MPSRRKPALVVGLGASAGGLEPLQRFFARVPAATGLTFAVVQHLDPRRPSLLADLLARHAAIPVVEAADGMRAEPDHVYVAGPGTLLTIEQDVFKVTRPAVPAAYGAIDIFFRSLAATMGSRAVAVLFSGAGHDGTVGLRAIKEQDGLTLAQALETAGHASMPQSAIEAGLVDHVLPPERLAEKLLEHAGFVATAEHAGASLLEPRLADNLGRICAVIKRHTGHDFTSYKEGTLVRRIRRRLQILRLSTVDAYLESLETDAAEAESLVKDLLIGVTQFFRDPVAFQALANQVVPRLLQGRTADVPLRIWVPGCASGEEAYSIAILVREQLERQGSVRHVQIFATDLDAEMLAEARIGRYPLTIAEHVGPDRLARFFGRERDGYHAVKDLREMCIFSQHSLIRDPPFSQLDLVSCRNVLIYFSAQLQKKLPPLFHYALRPGGFLFLGPSEGLTASPELFETVDKSCRIFRRRETLIRPVVDFPLGARGGARPAQTAPQAAGREQPLPTLQQRVGAAFQRAVLDEYAAPCAVVNERGDLVLVAGRLDRYFRLPSGAVTTNLVDLLPAALRGEFRRALHSAAAAPRRVVRDGIPVELDDGTHRVRLTVRPVPGLEADSGLLLVAVQDHAPLDPPGQEEAGELAEEPALDRLESELRTTRAELRTTVEELESANEELKSSNEELISTNEELQSANEELQTSREELQSLNEELETVNAELRQKVEELAAANSDLQNLFASTEIATIFLDPTLRIAKFTPAATRLFRLIEGDVGRPIGDLAPRFQGEDLVGAAGEVLRTLTPIDRQVQAGDGAWFIVRAIPYRTIENVIQGVVVTFVDVTQLKRAEEDLRRTTERERFLAETLENATTPFGVGAPDGRLLLFNRAFAELTGYSREELVDPALSWAATLTPPEWHDLEAEALARAVRTRSSVSYQKEYRRKDGTRVPIELVVQPVFGDDGAVLHYRSFLADITERKETEQVLEHARSTLAEAQEVAHLGSFEYVASSRTTAWSAEEYRIYGLEPAGPSPAYDVMLEKCIHPDDRALLHETFTKAMQGGLVYELEHRIVRPDGSVRWVYDRAHPYFDDRGGLLRYVGATLDITERKATEARLAYLASFPEENTNPIVEADARGRVRYANPAAHSLFPDLAEQGSAHPWLTDWESLAGSLEGDHGAVRTREVKVGARVYQQTLVVPHEEGVIRVYGMDITRRAAAEESLRQSREDLDRAQVVGQIGSWRLDTRKNVLTWSDENHRIFGVPKGTPLTYEAFLATIHPDDREYVDRQWQAGLRGEPYDIEHRIVAGGRVRWVRERAYLEFDRGGHLLGGFGITQDISERKAAEEALLRSREGLNRLAEASLSVMAKTDLGDMLRAVSEAALALTGARLSTSGHGLVSGQYIVGGSARAAGAPACPPGEMFRLDKGGVHMALVEGAESIRLTDAELRAHPRWWGLAPEHVPMRGLLGVAMVARDGRTDGMILVTDKAHGDFTPEDETLLRQLATVASLALQHVEARISLEESDRRKNQFLAMLSHELRNPLAPIHNSLFILERATRGSEQAVRAQAVIHRQVGHLTRLVDDLLDVTRISRGKIQLQRERLDLGDLVRRAVDDYRDAFAQGGLALELSLPDGAVWVQADRTRLAQVIGNLLSNAAKFTPAGGGAAVSLERNVDLAQAVLRVRDSGIGISHEMLPRVFEPFAQADSTLDRSQGGLGLGLAMVKGLAELHGGTASVESAGLGKGTEFAVRLALDVADLPPEPSASRRVQADGGRRVLVIEDNVDAAESLRALLELTGHTVAVAFSGPEGIAKAREFAPDVVLCDIGLPALTGYEVAHAMRQDPALRDTRLVALTGYAGVDDVARAQEAGFDAHLAKPPSPEAIEAILTRGGNDGEEM